MREHNSAGDQFHSGSLSPPPTRPPLFHFHSSFPSISVPLSSRCFSAIWTICLSSCTGSEINSAFWGCLIILPILSIYIWTIYLFSLFEDIKRSQLNKRLRLLWLRSDSACMQKWLTLKWLTSCLHTPWLSFHQIRNLKISACPLI